MAKGRWTELEHQKFLEGLDEHGKGAWKVIAEQVVQTRSAEQVRIHAQKYFLRQDKAKRRKRDGGAGCKYMMPVVGSGIL